MSQGFAEMYIVRCIEGDVAVVASGPLSSKDRAIEIAQYFTSVSTGRIWVTTNQGGQSETIWPTPVQP